MRLPHRHLDRRRFGLVCIRASRDGQRPRAAQAAQAAQAAAKRQGLGDRQRRAAASQASRPISTSAAAGAIKVLPKTAEELKGDQAAQAAWEERCRPTVVEDREGLRRVKYAERDCDLSRFNSAGN